MVKVFKSIAAHDVVLGKKTTEYSTWEDVTKPAGCVQYVVRLTTSSHPSPVAK